MSSNNNKCLNNTCSWGPWMPHSYPMAPPIRLYFRISKNGKLRQYQTRYRNEDNKEEIWDREFIPFPNDDHFRDFEHESIADFQNQIIH